MSQSGRHFVLTARPAGPGGGLPSWGVRRTSSHTLSKAAFGTLDPKFRPEGTALFNLSRVYCGKGTIGIAVVSWRFVQHALRSL